MIEGSKELPGGSDGLIAVKAYLPVRSSLGFHATLRRCVFDALLHLCPLLLHLRSLLTEPMPL